MQLTKSSILFPWVMGRCFSQGLYSVGYIYYGLASSKAMINNYVCQLFKLLNYLFIYIAILSSSAFHLRHFNIFQIDKIRCQIRACICNKTRI